jgi:hypothetical protein
VRAKTLKKKPAKDRPARLVLRFDSRTLRDEFRGWLSDGGGEQAFMADLEYFMDTRQDRGMRCNLAGGYCEPLPIETPCGEPDCDNFMAKHRRDAGSD